MSDVDLIEVALPTYRKILREPVNKRGRLKEIITIVRPIIEKQERERCAALVESHWLNWPKEEIITAIREGMRDE